MSYLKKLCKMLNDERGTVVTTELLVLTGVIVTIASAIVGGLLPSFQGLESRAENSIIQLNETGF